MEGITGFDGRIFVFEKEEFVGSRRYLHCWGSSNPRDPTRGEGERYKSASYVAVNHTLITHH
jgi:hypothetical protein